MSNYRERELEYISAVNTTGNFVGWLKLNLTACLPTWVAFPDSNKGLYLSVHPVDKPGKSYNDCHLREIPEYLVTAKLFILRNRENIQDISKIIKMQLYFFSFRYLTTYIGEYYDR